MSITASLPVEQNTPTESEEEEECEEEEDSNLVYRVAPTKGSPPFKTMIYTSSKEAEEYLHVVMDRKSVPKNWPVFQAKISIEKTSPAEDKKEKAEDKEKAEKEEKEDKADEPLWPADGTEKATSREIIKNGLYEYVIGGWENDCYDNFFEYIVSETDCRWMVAHHIVCMMLREISFSEDNSSALSCLASVFDRSVGGEHSIDKYWLEIERIILATDAVKQFHLEARKMFEVYPIMLKIHADHKKYSPEWEEKISQAAKACGSSYMLEFYNM